MTPAIMIQAEDRAHRIGQEHNCVNIHYLYGPNTLDEVLFRMLNQKQNIFTNTLDRKAKNMEVRGTTNKFGDFQGEEKEQYVEEKEEKVDKKENKEKKEDKDKKEKKEKKDKKR
jgi:SWI/SNF-related matrix-associated actin-dependent regulator 1 of chromatin subfamily A